MGMNSTTMNTEWQYYESEMDQEPVPGDYEDNESVEIDMADYQAELEEYEMADENLEVDTFAVPVDMELPDENTHYELESYTAPEIPPDAADPSVGAPEAEFKVQSIPEDNLELREASVPNQTQASEQDSVQQAKESPVVANEELHDPLSEITSDSVEHVVDFENSTLLQVGQPLLAEVITEPTNKETAAVGRTEAEARPSDISLTDNDVFDYVEAPGPVLMFVASSDQPDIALFNLPDDKQEGSSNTVQSPVPKVALLLSEKSQWELYYRPLDEVFAALRQDERISTLEGADEGELVLEAVDLDMYFSEV